MFKDKPLYNIIIVYCSLKGCDLSGAAATELATSLGRLSRLTKLK